MSVLWDRLRENLLAVVFSLALFLIGEDYE